MSVEITHLLFALAGAALTYFFQGQSPIPADVLSALETVLTHQKVQQAHGVLQSLATTAASILPPPTLPAQPAAPVHGASVAKAVSPAITNPPSPTTA